MTGIGGEGPEETSAANLEPVKHGVNYALISNRGFDPVSQIADIASTVAKHRQTGYYLESALPMHPRCFQMFKKLSLEQRGTVDIDALWRWRDVRVP